MVRSYRAVALGLALGATALTGAHALEAEQRSNSNQLWFDGGSSFTHATLKVQGPDGYFESFYSERGTPTFKTSGGKLADGMYFYNLTAATDKKIPVDSKLENGRGEAARDTMAEAFELSGSFEILRGAIIAAPDTATGATTDTDNDNE